MSGTRVPLTPGDADAHYPRPAMRKLRVYAFDPQASRELDTAVVNDAIIALPWEQPWEEPLTPGPCGEYLEVIDHDPASGLFYAPVDLNDPLLLAQDGLPPSEGRPQFHQQMVYAVAMKTIRLFERALGRPVMWAREVDLSPAEKHARRSDGRVDERDFIPKLRIYPHALREANAYYSPEKTALLFGYFPPSDSTGHPDKWVFTCLSQDIVAHETAHAILHGMHRRSIQASNPDTLAFHEAFADIVALFQHFTMTEVVAHQIAQSRGVLRRSALLTGLARQFGQAIGRGGSLRHALDLIEQQQAAEREPDAAKRAALIAAIPKFTDATEPHARGGFLVAAVFDAFVTIWERRIADLLRIGTGSSTPNGEELSSDLVQRLASEANKAADHILRMCVRALDYIPPIDLRFGEYLRAIVTADADLVPEDPLRYRVAVAEAFRRCGITAPDCISMAPDSLLWEAPDPRDLPPTEDQCAELFSDLLPKLKLSQDFQPTHMGRRTTSYRQQTVPIIQHNQRTIWYWLNTPSPHDLYWEKMLGVRLLAADNQPLLPDGTRRPALRSIRWKDGLPAVEVHSARVARRAGPDGQELGQLVVQVAQRRAGFLDPERQAQCDRGEIGEDERDFWFRGGATLLIDIRGGHLRNVIRKSIDNEHRLAAERDFQMMDLLGGQMGMAIYQTPAGQRDADREPFAMIHRS